MSDFAESVSKWAQMYRTAWESNDPDDIRAAFTEDAVYRDGPSNPTPWIGHDGIVAGWLDAQDAPDDVEFTWETLALEGDVAVLRCVSDYVKSGRVYDNLWVVRLAPDGRAREYTDWFVLRPDSPADAVS
jgi:ketosteroid isomerase-like protein